MCFMKAAAAKPMPVVPPPEKVAEPQEIGGTRKAEDEALFGDEGQSLRVNREAVGTGATAGGTGLRMM